MQQDRESGKVFQVSYYFSTQSFGLALDYYELTMAAAHFARGHQQHASFDLFVRKLPSHRSFLVVAGLEQALHYLQEFRFPEKQIAWLRTLPAFAEINPEFFEYLRNFRFTGEIQAMPEGTIAFAGEPLLTVTAPIIEAQMVETLLLSIINFQTMIASKAARIVQAAEGRDVIEFGARRAHGLEAARYAARAAYIGGCVGTSYTEAAVLFDIPVFGTAAHSWTMSFESEREAFESYFQLFPDHTTLLLDTYDTLQAAHLATEFGMQLRGVRLDSGDLVELSKQVRAILDDAGMQATRIMASGDLDEYIIERLLAAGARIDSFGVGTALSTSFDAPALGGVYKLVETQTPHGLRPAMKLSRDKITWPYRKQVWRVQHNNGEFVEDFIAAWQETGDEKDNEYSLRGCSPLLRTVLRGGEIIAPLPSLKETRQYAQQQIQRLPKRFRKLHDAEIYPVSYSKPLAALREQALASLENQHLTDKYRPGQIINSEEVRP
jgi:nicotinate phosphoribosyltransferase